jgi:hypothetical protein
LLKHKNINKSIFENEKSLKLSKHKNINKSIFENEKIKINKSSKYKKDKYL